MYVEEHFEVSLRTAYITTFVHISVMVPLCLNQCKTHCISHNPGYYKYTYTDAGPNSE